MERESFTNDQVEQGIGHFLSLSAAALAATCEWIMAADRGQLFLTDGARTLPEWLSAHFGWRHATAAQLVRVARRLQDLPRLRRLFAEGSLSLDQVDSISKLATPDTEDAVIAACAGLSNAALDRAARRANPPSTADELEAWRERWTSIQGTLDGFRGRMTTDLPGAEMGIVEAEIRRRADLIPPNSGSGMFDPYQQRMADGLVELCATSGADNTTGRTQIVVHADLESLATDPETTGVAEIEGGPVIANETAGRLSCDPLVECTVYDHARTLGIGRRSRLIPAWLRRQLWFRDGVCVWPGCPRTHFVHAHHRQHWADGGTTHRSTQSGPSLRISPPVPARAWLVDRR